MRRERITFISSVAVRGVRLRFVRKGTGLNAQSRARKRLNSGRGLKRISNWGPSSGGSRGGEPSEVASAVQSVEMLRNERTQALR
jgi:hypothetical protein